MHERQSAGGSSSFPFRCMNLRRSSSQASVHFFTVSPSLSTLRATLFVCWLTVQEAIEHAACQGQLRRTSHHSSTAEGRGKALSTAKWAGRRNERTLTNTENQTENCCFTNTEFVQVLLLSEEVLRHQMYVVNIKYTNDLRYPSRCPLFAVTWSNDPWRRRTLAVSDVTIPPVIHNARQF